MKAECIREKLLHALTRADKVTGKNPSLAILSCVIIAAEGNQVVLKSTNLEVGLEVVIPAKVESDGIVAIQADILASFLSNTPQEKNVTLEMIDNTLIATAGLQKATIKTFGYEDFPGIPNAGEDKVDVDVEDFFTGLQSVWYSASVSSIKPELSSVYVYNQGDNLVFVATDSFRLAEKRVKVKGIPLDFQLLIPFKNISDIVKAFEGVTGMVELSYNKNQLTLRTDSIYLASRLVDGIFPDYKKIIPNEHSTETTILKSDFVQALRMMRVFSDKFNQVSLSVSNQKSHCEFASKNSDVGEGNYTIKAKVVGDSVKLTFNHKYLIDCLSAIPAESLIMRFNGVGKALIVTGYHDDSFKYLVMPNRAN
jgi:DNA polymerase III subunit beta